MTHCDVCHPDVNAITEPVDHRGPAHDAVAGLKPETRRWMRQWLSDNPAALRADHATPDTDEPGCRLSMGRPCGRCEWCAPDHASHQGEPGEEE